MRKIFRINYSKVDREEAERLLGEVIPMINEVPSHAALSDGLRAYWQQCETYPKLIRVTIHKDDRRVQVIGLVT